MTLTLHGMAPDEDVLRGPPGIEATMLLCDAAQAVGGKLYVLGGGWSQIAEHVPGTGYAMALAIKLAIPWDRANQQFQVRAALVTEDGESVDVGAGPVAAEGAMEVGRPPGLRPGTPLDSTLALNFSGLALEPGGYVWQLEVDAQVLARTAFRVLG